MIDCAQFQYGPLSARLRLLQVAARLFAEHGLEGTSVRDIAKVAGLNLSLVSYYFGGKEGLYKELLQGFAVTIKEQIEKIIEISEAQETSRENIEKLFSMIVANFSDIREKNPHLSLIMQRERLAGLPFAREIYEKNFTPIGRNLMKVLAKAQKLNLVRKDLSPLLVFIFLQEAALGYHTIVDCRLEITQSSTAAGFKDYQKQLVTIFVQGIFQ